MNVLKRLFSLFRSLFRPDPADRFTWPVCVSCGVEGVELNDGHPCRPCICRREADPLKPCHVPRRWHPADRYEINRGPDGGRFAYVKFWYDAERRRYRAKMHATSPALPPVGDPVWDAALIVYLERVAREEEEVRRYL